MAELKALMLNCTLKPSPQVSNTKALLDRVAEILHELDCETEIVRVVDHRVPFGVESDLGEATSGRRSSRGSSPPTS
jgi:hypothetical protein